MKEVIGFIVFIAMVILVAGVEGGAIEPTPAMLMVTAIVGAISLIGIFKECR